jgi:hypothetical protein
MNIGDRVRLLNRKEEGIIHKIHSDGTATFAEHAGGLDVYGAHFSRNS